MAHIYEKLLTALKAHWKAHNNAYPKKFIIITTAEHAALTETRSSIQKAVTGKLSHDHFDVMDVKLEVDDTTPGVVVDKDGMEIPLADYDKMPA